MKVATKKTPTAKLTPHPGSNPERLPTPRCPLLDSFYQGGVCPELCYLTSVAVGHAVAVYWCSSDPTTYQVMKWDEKPGPGREFWSHQLWERPQWYSTPEAACAAYVASYQIWIEKYPEAP